MPRHQPLALALVFLAGSGCADECLDDGFGQSECASTPATTGDIASSSTAETTSDPEQAGVTGDATSAGAGSTGSSDTAEATSSSETAPTAECGDGFTEGSEQCDDAGESKTCNADCTLAACGDGVVNVSAGETCDDAGRSARCNEDCTLTTCGDGIVNAAAGETCDDGGETLTCNADCTDATCGDGVTNATAGEVCDDSGESATCNLDCSPAACGDGVVNATAGEDCDVTENSATCDEDCTTAECGDGLLNLAAGEACDEGGPTAECTADCQVARRLVFVTSTTHTGDLGGLAGADAICSARAAAAGLEGTYFAWLSSSTDSPLTRFAQASVPYERVDGVQIAANWSDLIDGTLDAPINVTELGGTAPLGTTDCGGAPSSTTWSATTSGGASIAATVTCDDWTSDTAGPVGWGHPTATDGTWSQWCGGGGGSCGTLSALYCFQQ